MTKIEKIIWIVGFLVLTLFAVTGAANAANITVEGDRIKYSGPVEVGDAEELVAAMEVFGINKVVLRSEGGAAQEGFAIGKLFYQRNTEVFVDGYCLSACAIAFIGTPNVNLDGGFIGFHNAWVQIEMETNKALAQGQFLGIMTSAYFMDKGYSVLLPFYISQLTTPEVFLTFDTVEQLRVFFVGRNQPADTYLENVDMPERFLADRLADSRRISLMIQGK